MWRKNRRDNDDGSFGVDLARNFGWTWGLDNQGSSPIPSAIGYRGPYPFSEPETQHLRDFVNAHHIVLAMDCHSYGNVYLFPWGTSYYDDDGLTPDDATYRMIADSMAYFIEQVYGTVFPTGTGWELYYNTNGTPFDWEYGDTTSHDRIMAFSPEFGTWDDGFWPTLARRDSLEEEILSAHIFFARIAGQFVAPSDVTIEYHPETSTLVIRWSPAGALMYRIYSSMSPGGPFDSLVNTTTSTSATVSLPVAEKSYYIVRSVY